jgi:HlyD family secretion protein
LKAAEAQLAVVEAQIASAEAQVNQRQTQVSQARVELERTEIRAPVDGIVVKKSVEPGQTVAASLQAPDLFLIAQDLKQMQVLASIDESEVGRLRVGQPVMFTVDSFRGRSFKGTVSQIRKSATVVQSVVTYLAVIEASNPDLSLFPGMTANLRIIVDKRENVLKIPSAALRFRPTIADNHIERKSAPMHPLRHYYDKALRLVSGGGSKIVRAGPDRPSPAMPNGVTSVRTQPVSGAGTKAAGTAARVWVEDADGNPRPVHVRLGLSDGSHNELLHGELAEGEQVIIGTNSPPGPAKKRAAPRFF